MDDAIHATMTVLPARTTAEFRRLYAAAPPADPAAPLTADELVDAQGRVRAAVLELAQPPDWPTLAAVWQAVQGDPDDAAEADGAPGAGPPAIAVSGRDGLQLWFSWAAPCDPAAVHGWLARLCRQHLPDVAPRRLRLWPAADGAGPLPTPPGMPTTPGCWSAFVSPDLAPVFDDTPWLEMPPGDEGQARLLADLRSRPAAALHAAVPVDAPPSAVPAAPPRPDAPALDPADFLRAVMADVTAPLALRIEAAKALLAHARSPGPGAMPTRTVAP